MEAAILPGPPVKFGVPVKLFSLPISGNRTWDVSQDGSRVIVSAPRTPAVATITVIRNWSIGGTR